VRLDETALRCIIESNGKERGGKRIGGEGREREEGRGRGEGEKEEGEEEGGGGKRIRLCETRKVK